MEAELDDLPSFQEKNAAIEEIGYILHVGLVCTPLEKITDALCEKDEERRKRLVESYNEDVTLGKRLMDSIKIEME